VPLGLQPVDTTTQVARGPGPGQTATQRGGAQQADTEHPGQVAQHVQGAAGQLRSVPAPVSAPAVSASAAASRRNGSHRPVWRSGSPIGLAVVTVMAAADQASNTSGSCSAP